MTVTIPTPVLDEGTLYLAEDRFVCAKPTCAGQTALVTGRTVHGVEVVRVEAHEIRELQNAWSEAGLTGPIQCECGAVSA